MNSERETSFSQNVTAEPSEFMRSLVTPFATSVTVCTHVARLVWTNLEVKVGYFPGVEVVHPLEDLLDELSGLFLAQRLLLRQEVKQLTSRDPETQTLIIQRPVAG